MSGRMISYLWTVVFLFVRVHASISSYEPFNPMATFESNLNPREVTNRKFLLSNRINECDLEDIFQLVGVNEIEDLVEALALRKGTNPYSILRLLQKRLKTKEENGETLFKTVDLASIPEILSPPLEEIHPPSRTPPPSRIPPPARIPPPSRIPPPARIPPFEATIYSLEGESTNKDVEDTNVRIIPVDPTQNSLPNSLPKIMKPDFKTRNGESMGIANTGHSDSRINDVFPALLGLPPMKTNPFSATVQLNIDTKLHREFTITVSPLMTIVEALRQAEIKYQVLLGLPQETDLFTFTMSSIMECYMVTQIHDVTNDKENAWKVTISDRQHQVVYSDFCLPNGRDAVVKPGMLISLSYIPF